MKFIVNVIATTTIILMIVAIEYFFCGYWVNY